MIDKNCPRCGIKRKGIHPLKEGTGCDYCEPKCNYCGEYLKEFKMDHLVKCKVFQEKIKEKRK